jgi:hypothetical protein
MFWSELVDERTVRIRLDLECEENTLRNLIGYWEQLWRVQSVVVTPALAGREEPPARDGAPRVTEEFTAPVPEYTI